MKMLPLKSSLKLFSFTCIFLSLSCGDDEEKKEQAEINNVKVCETTNTSRTCTDSAATLEANITRIFGSARFNIKGENGTFTISWFRIQTDGTQVTVSQKNVSATQVGAGTIFSDISNTEGFNAGDYRFEVSFDNPTSHGITAIDFKIE